MQVSFCKATENEGFQKPSAQFSAYAGDGIFSLTVQSQLYLWGFTLLINKQLKLDVCNCLMLKSAKGYECVCVCIKFLNKTLLCFIKILNFVVNMRQKEL